MFDQAFRNIKSRYVEPLLANVRVPPLFITFLSFASGTAALVAFYFDANLLAVLLWIACRVFDGLDGMVARITEKQSDIGGYVDLVGDFLLYAALPIVIAFRLGETIHFAVAAILLGVFYVNAAVWMAASAIYEKHRAKKGQTTITMPLSLVEGFETMILNCLMLAFPENFIIFTIIMAALTLCGAVVCFIQSILNFKHIDSNNVQ